MDGAPASRPPDRGDDLRVTLVSVFIVTCNILPVAFVGALSSLIGAELGFAEARFGLMVGLFFVASAVLSLLLGGTIERWGPTFSMRVSAASGAVGMLVIVLVGDSWAVITAGLLVTAFGMAVGTPAANLALSRRVRTSRRGLAFGIKQASAPAGSLLAGLAVTLLAVRLGWRGAIVAAIVVTLVGVFLIPDVDGPRRGGEDRPTDGRPGRRVRGAAAVRTRSWPRTMRTAAVGFGLCNVGAGSLKVFVVPTVVAAGIDVATAGTILAVGSAAGVLARIVVGWWADGGVRGRFRAVALMVAVGGVGFGLLAVGVSVTVLTVGTVLGFMAGWGWNGLFALAVVEENPSAPALATGQVQFGGLAGSAVGPIAFGAVAESAGYVAAWGMTVVTAAVGALLMWRTHRLVLAQADEERRREERRSGAAAGGDPA